MKNSHIDSRLANRYPQPRLSTRGVLGGNGVLANMVQFELVVTGGKKKQRSRRWSKVLLGLGGLLVAGWLFVSSGFFLN
ncbi:MAG TPA: hypothetical protein QGH16_03170, partial [Verrucomicrobiota bacterium]|nr:hypothetical protein [Verrucomicrobiota bacterium]